MLLTVVKIEVPGAHYVNQITTEDSRAKSGCGILPRRFQETARAPTIEKMTCQYLRWYLYKRLNQSLNGNAYLCTSSSLFR